jgi:hypothetical protein
VGGLLDAASEANKVWVSWYLGGGGVVFYTVCIRYMHGPYSTYTVIHSRELMSIRLGTSFDMTHATGSLPELLSSLLDHVGYGRIMAASKH